MWSNICCGVGRYKTRHLPQPWDFLPLGAQAFSKTYRLNWRHSSLPPSLTSQLFGWGSTWGRFPATLLIGDRLVLTQQCLHYGWVLLHGAGQGHSLYTIHYTKYAQHTAAHQLLGWIWWQRCLSVGFLFWASGHTFSCITHHVSKHSTCQYQILAVCCVLQSPCITSTTRSMYDSHREGVTPVSPWLSPLYYTQCCCQHSVFRELISFMGFKGTEAAFWHAKL